MPKPSARAEINSFVGGLITEASPLNFPPNASRDEANFELNRDGTRDRRLGLDYEPLGVLQDVSNIYGGNSSTPFTSYIWKGAGGNTFNELVVVQVAYVLYVYNSKVSPISAGSVGVIYNAALVSECSFTTVDGKLVVASGQEDVAVVTYNESAAIGSRFTVSKVRLLVRDLWGIQVTGDTRFETDPKYQGAQAGAKDPKHYYNLQNQSWGLPRRDGSNTLDDPITIYNNFFGRFPSNTEVVWTGLQFQPVVNGVTFERMYPGLYEDLLGVDTTASKGFYIIDFLRRGGSRQTEYTKNATRLVAGIIDAPAVTFPSDFNTDGPTVVCEFAGRVFYSGFGGRVIDPDSRSPGISNYVLFSQLIKGPLDFSKCYQEGDPSSRENSDVVDTDGGFVKIAGANRIIKLINLESSLVVIADNGVWSLTGGNDFGFSATNYKVTKLSSFGGLAASSVVVEGSRAFFWSNEGIFGIAKDSFGSLTVANITEKSIQTLYENIQDAAKSKAVGGYDPIGKKIRWLYVEGVQFPDTNTSEVRALVKELVLDTVLNVFYKNVIYDTPRPDKVSIGVVGLFTASAFNRGLRESGRQSMRYVILQRTPNTFPLAGVSFSLGLGYYYNENFEDWGASGWGGTDAKAFMITGQQTASDSAVSKQIPYLITYLKRTEKGVTSDSVPDKPSGLFMRCQWDFASSILSNKWSALVQAYRYKRAQYITGLSDLYANGFDMVVTKNKVRGRGKVFSLYFETEPRKDCRIVGWSISFNGNTIT